MTDFIVVTVLAVRNHVLPESFLEFRFHVHQFRPDAVYVRRIFLGTARWRDILQDRPERWSVTQHYICRAYIDKLDWKLHVIIEKSSRVMWPETDNIHRSGRHLAENYSWNDRVISPDIRIRKKRMIFENSHLIPNQFLFFRNLICVLTLEACKKKKTLKLNSSYEPSNSERFSSMGFKWEKKFDHSNSFTLLIRSDCSAPPSWIMPIRKFLWSSPGRVRLTHIREQYEPALCSTKDILKYRRSCSSYRRWIRVSARKLQSLGRRRRTRTWVPKPVFFRLYRPSRTRKIQKWTIISYFYRNFSSRSLTVTGFINRYNTPVS